MYNKYQTEVTNEILATYPQEVQEQFFDFINNVEFVKRLVSPNRCYAKDRPRDSKGRIIVDLANPHILEDMDYFRPSAIAYRNNGGRYTTLKPNANPNSEYGKWIREEIRRCWEGYIRPSDGEWVTGYMYFYLNYCPIILSKMRKGTKQADRVLDFPEVWEGIYWRFHYIDQMRNGGLYDQFAGGKHGAELARRGASKAHPYNTIVYTPSGMKLWKDINIGDTLFTESGETTKVIDIPFDDYCDIYEITLRDGRKIQSSDAHLWKIIKRGKEQLLSTKEIYNNYFIKRKISERNPKGIEYIYSIPKNKGAEFPTQSVKIDPYTFGLLLGDGCFVHKSCYYTCNSKDFKEIKNYIPYTYNKWKGKYGYRLHIPNWKKILNFYKLNNLKSEYKFIPDEFKYNNRNVRLQILKGLIDSDGYINKHGLPEISLSSKHLIQDIQWICRSLGYNCSYIETKSGYKKDNKYIKCLPTYTLTIHTLDTLALLSRKRTIAKTNNYARSRELKTRIINVEYIGVKKAKCVTVDSPTYCYLIGEFITTHNSYSLGSIAAHNFILGENSVARSNINTVITAYQKEYLIKDGTLNKFVSMADFCAEHTQFPRRRLKSSLQEMVWTMGYKDVDTNIDKGTKNTVMGVSSKDDESKMRGKRAHILVDEFGTFARLIDAYNVWIPSVQEGDVVFAMIYMCGTAGDSQSDFAGAQEIMYSPTGYNMYALPNVYDKNNQGKRDFVFFFPGYVNRKGCYNKDGVSDITKALLEILMNRYRVKYNSTDPNTILKTVAEIPITPSEAIIRTGFNLFPVTDLTERLLQLDSNPREYDDVYVGDLIVNKKGEVEYSPSSKQPIRDFPTKDNKVEGAIELFQLPEIDKKTGKPYTDRYIGGVDPYDDDTANTMSLGSIFILDLWTDKIVAEYTGRPLYANDFYEIVRRMSMFYNARINYEQNKKGLFSYFSQHNCLYLLTDQLEFLRDKQLIKDIGYGNKSKGTTATAAINNYARNLLREWLLKPIVSIQEVDGEQHEVSIPNLYTLRNRALIKELIGYNNEGNFDRISSMGMLMLLREDKMILYQGDLSKSKDITPKDYLGNDPFFEKNFKKKESSKVHWY